MNYSENINLHTHRAKPMSQKQGLDICWSPEAHFPRSIYLCTQQLMWHEKGSDFPTLWRTPVIHWTWYADELLLLLKHSYCGKWSPWINQQHGDPSSSARSTRLTPSDRAQTSTGSRDRLGLTDTEGAPPERKREKKGQRQMSGILDYLLQDFNQGS